MAQARLRPRLLVMLAAPALTVLAACEQENTYQAPPPPEVTVALPVQQPITRYLEETGNTATVQSVDLVARVQGYLQKIQYKDGATVKKGTPLFVIEPEPFQLKLDQSVASEMGAQASLDQLEAEFKRQSDLASRQFASKATLNSARAARDGAKAKLLQSQADKKQAEINLSYTKVIAPFDGIVTARLVSLGDLVGGSTATKLATIVELNPIYVNFSIGEQEAARLNARRVSRGQSVEDFLGKVPVEVGLQTEDGYPHRGVLDYIVAHARPLHRHAGGARGLSESEAGPDAWKFRPGSRPVGRECPVAAGARHCARQRSRADAMSWWSTATMSSSSGT